ncbi:MAG: DUF493 domain-containing protein [Desulfobulbaceae bacterium]|nr:DUF493 domain-containing protein [Desulfobulbaceae bacterium]
MISRKDCNGNTERPKIDYPCSWVYKVIGEDCSLLKEAITTACAPGKVNITHSKASSKGKYHSLNAELIVLDEETRLKIYETLKTSPAVKMVL